MKKPPESGGDSRKTSSGIELKPSYGPAEGRPGRYPYTRGLYPEMYRRRRWTMRQYAGYGDAAESNQRFRYLLEQGTTGLSVAFDLPTQIGYDSDHPLARGEVGRVGVSIDSIHDMRRLFDRVPLAEVTTSMTINATATTLLALYLVVAEEQGADWQALGGTVPNNDFSAQFDLRNTILKKRSLQWNGPDRPCIGSDLITLLTISPRSCPDKLIILKYKCNTSTVEFRLYRVCNFFFWIPSQSFMNALIKIP